MAGHATASQDAGPEPPVGRKGRYLEPSILADLPKRMAFVAGPRQVGKTTVARRLLEQSGGGRYFSFDRRDDRREALAARWPADPTLVVLDELHKMRGWKRWLKGEFDRHGERIRFLVTGSARLDVFRRGGDSLQGRYHHYRLHPFSLAEAEGRSEGRSVAPGSALQIGRAASASTLDALLRFGGFPEPFLAASERTHRRWQKERLERFFREDVRDLEPVSDLVRLETLAELMLERVGSPLSLNALREDLEVSHATAARWLAILDRLYHVFLVPPFAHRAVRALRKMPKAYLFDPSLVAAPGARFENLVAAHLLKFCHYLEDAEGHPVELRYLRDQHGREVDFVVLHRKKPWFAVECRTGGKDVSPSLRYFASRLGIEQAYQVTLGDDDFLDDGIRVVPARRFLAALA